MHKDGDALSADDAAVVVVPPPKNLAALLVTAVDVDLATGRVEVTSATPIPADAVRVAVEEAGYEVVS